MTAHRDLTGDDLHEPKGIEFAPIGTVYVSDGNASGEWKQISTTEIDYGSIFNINKYKLYYTLKDISTASTVFIPISDNCRLNLVTGVINGTITGADCKIELKNNGLTSMGMFEISYTTSGAGVVNQFIPTANAELVAPGYIVMVCGGESTGVVDLNLVLDFEYV